VVKVISHKAPRRVDGWFNVIQQVTAMCAPMKAHWRHLANTIELVHPLAHSSPQPKRQMDRFSRFCTAYGTNALYNGRPYPTELPFPTGDQNLPCNTMLWAHVSSQPKRHFDRFSRACTDDCRVSLYGLPVSPSKLFLPMLASGPHVIHGSLGPTESGTQMAT